MNSTKLLPAILITACTLGFIPLSHAQLSYVSGTKVLTLDGDEPGVLRFVPPVTNPGVVNLTEPDGWGATGETGRFSFITYGVTGQWQGYTAPFAAPFTSDVNENGFTDNRFDNYQMGPIPSPSGIEGDFALQYDAGTWADKVYIFKVQNNSGASITNWRVGIDTWYDDQSNNVSTLRIAYATTYAGVEDSGGSFSWGPNWTELSSRASTNTGEGLSALEHVGGDFAAEVPNGEFFYVAVFYDMDTGGNKFIIDNLTIGQTPPPSGGFDDWAAAFADPVLSDLSAGADPDNDGSVNVVEYVLGTDPRFPNGGGPLCDVLDTNFIFTFTRAENSKTDDIGLQVVVSTDLTDWDTEPSFTVGVDTDSSSTGVTVDDNGAADDLVTVVIPMGVDVAKFARLKVIHTP